MLYASLLALNFIQLQNRAVEIVSKQTDETNAEHFIIFQLRVSRQCKDSIKKIMWI